MSGGFFNYDQHRIGHIIDKLEDVIENNGKEKTAEELRKYYVSPEYYENHPDEKYHAEYSFEVIELFKKAVSLLRIAEVYAHHIDLLLSGDNNEESFLEQLKKDLEKINQP
jgi:hypothetical protein